MTHRNKVLVFTLQNDLYAGNFARPDGKTVDTTCVTINFDINVVPDDQYQEYEQYYSDHLGSQIDNLTESKEPEKGYYLNNGAYAEDEDFMQ